VADISDNVMISRQGHERFCGNVSIHEMTIHVNPSTPQHKCWGLLRVDPERRFIPHPKGWGLAPPNGSICSMDHEIREER